MRSRPSTGICLWHELHTALPVSLISNEFSHTHRTYIDSHAQVLYFPGLTGFSKLFPRIRKSWSDLFYTVQCYRTTPMTDVNASALDYLFLLPTMKVKANLNPQVFHVVVGRFPFRRRYIVKIAFEMYGGGGEISDHICLAVVLLFSFFALY